jgi:DNA-binding transcriptional LysR family regulator
VHSYRYIVLQYRPYVAPSRSGLRRPNSSRARQTNLLQRRTDRWTFAKSDTSWAVARHGAVRRAAATLNLDQSIVSAKTRDLEAELGVRLFERHSGGVRLTGAGEVFVAGATRALQTLEDTASKVKTAGRGQSGALRIGYVWSVAAGPANALLSEQRAHAPAVGISLREQGSANSRPG